jgi:hypothetical protein
MDYRCRRWRWRRSPSSRRSWTPSRTRSRRRKQPFAPRYTVQYSVHISHAKLGIEGFSPRYIVHISHAKLGIEGILSKVWYVAVLFFSWDTFKNKAGNKTASIWFWFWFCHAVCMCVCGKGEGARAALFFKNVKEYSAYFTL